MTSPDQAAPTQTVPPRPDYPQDLQDAAQLILGHQGTVVVVAHENPDGDALGSVLGLTRALRTLGKTVIAPLTPPRYLSFVPQSGELSEPLTAWPADTLLVVLDVDNNDPVRVAGADLTTYSGPVVNVDHHGTNKAQATALVLDPQIPAAAQMVTDLIDVLGVPWTEAIATPLMLGLLTDTGNFSFDSVTPATFECAARLRAHGARLGWLTDGLRQNPRSYYLLLRELLGSLEFLRDGQVVMARVDDAMLERAGATWEEVESYVSLLRNAEGSKLAVIVKDYGDRVKLSLRSRGGFSAQNVAVALGGGGHIPAAGATVLQPWTEVQPLLEQAISAELERSAAAQ